MTPAHGTCSVWRRLSQLPGMPQYHGTLLEDPTIYDVWSHRGSLWLVHGRHVHEMTEFTLEPGETPEHPTWAAIIERARTLARKGADT